MKLEANLIIKRSGSSLRPRSNFIFADDDDDNEDDNDDDNDGEHENDGDNDRLLPGPRSNFLLALLWNTEYRCNSEVYVSFYTWICALVSR